MTQEKKYESALLEALGMTDAQIRAELIEQGLDPASEAQALRSMVQRLVAKHHSRDPIDRRLGDAMRRKFAAFHESVSAGDPAPAAGGLAEGASLFELMRVANPAVMLWVRVSGWSMRDESIRDGDMVLIDTSREARDGDIVLACLAGRGQVIKRLRIPRVGPALAALESAHPGFEPIVITEPGDLLIHGVVVGRAGRIG